MSGLSLKNGSKKKGRDFASTVRPNGAMAQATHFATSAHGKYGEKPAWQLNSTFIPRRLDCIRIGQISKPDSASLN
jgi:hypothetical protein